MTKQELEARIKSLEDEIRCLKDIEEIKKLVKLRTLKEVKDLDEIALMTYNRKESI